MIICNDDFFKRLEKGELSAVERRRYLICQRAQDALGEIPIFYLARPQGVSAPAVFVRIARMLYHKKLGREIECALQFELRYLAERPHDDSECEQVMERLLDALGADSFDKQAVSAERTETGALIKAASKLRWKALSGDAEGGIMRSLETETNQN